MISFFVFELACSNSIPYMIYSAENGPTLTIHYFKFFNAAKVLKVAPLSDV